MVNNTNNVKIIFHIDLNAFFASVEAIRSPLLVGKPYAIGRENTFKGVISTASYEARKYGIHSGMSVAEAYKILPELIIVHGDMRIYQEYHKKFIRFISQYSELVEVASIDEAYVDMTEASKTRHPLILAKEIQDELLKQFSLPSSIGIAPTLFLAKMATDMKKPMGISVLRKREISKLLYPLPVKSIFGIGKKTYPKLMERGILTIGDFMNLENQDVISSIVGERNFQSCYQALCGQSTNVVDPNRNAISESISTSQTYDNYLTIEEDVLIELRSMTKEIHKGMVDKGYVTKTVSITLRDKNFKTITRSMSLTNYTKNLYEILDIVADLLEANYHSESLRLVGVRLSNLVLEKELKPEYNLFTYEQFINKEEVISSLINEFKEKYGDRSIRIGMEDKKKTI